MSKDLYILALNNLKERKIRSWLTIIGIVIGIASVIILMLLGNGFENAIKNQFDKMGISNIRIVTGNLRGPPAGNIGFNNSIINLVERVKSVEYVNPMLFNFASIEYGSEELYFPVIGYDTELSDKGFIDVDLGLEEGRFFRINEKGSAIVGYKIAKDRYKKEIFAKNTININGRQFKVVGIFENTGTDIDDRVYIPLDEARILFNKPDIVNALVVKIQDGIDISDAAEDIKRMLKRNYNEEEFVVFTPEQLINQLKDILNVVKILLSGIAAISLVVGGIGIMNSMFTSVLERRRQIGIMKAVGATNNQVLFTFLVESGLIGLGGGVIGAILGVIVAKSVGAIAALMGFGLLAVTLDFKIIGFMLLFSFTIGMLSGAIPAWQAAKLSPVEALRYE